ncbi:MAG: single-stranded DNA-binding protein [Massilioclostridium sp.]|nr:single-stranded DNA-binding protein [Massilioclostridium sp.]MEE1492938.1 single-stranded DNA-binding protein [Massilioclostridium sp.]
MKKIKQFRLGDLVGVIGYAAQDAELKQAGGADLCNFSLVIGKDESKEQGKQNVYCNCTAWRNAAEYAKNIEKWDTVLAIGHINKREYKEKEYVTLECDFINIMKVAAPPNSSEFDNLDTSESDDLGTGDLDYLFQ